MRPAVQPACGPAGNQCRHDCRQQAGLPTPPARAAGSSRGAKKRRSGRTGRLSAARPATTTCAASRPTGDWSGSAPCGSGTSKRCWVAHGHAFIGFTGMATRRRTSPGDTGPHPPEPRTERAGRWSGAAARSNTAPQPASIDGLSEAAPHLYFTLAARSRNFSVQAIVY